MFKEKKGGEKERERRKSDYGKTKKKLKFKTCFSKFAKKRTNMSKFF